MGIGQWIKKGFLTVSLAAAKVEKDSFSQNGSEEVAGRNQNIVTPFHKHQLAEDLIAGRETQRVKEFRKHYYQVLKESYNYKFDYKSGTIVKKSEDDNDLEGFDFDFSSTPQRLTEEDVQSLKRVKGDPYDTYEVEMVIDNRSSSAGMWESTSVRPVKAKRNVSPKFKIENHSDLIYVRHIDEKNKLIEFYVNKEENRNLINEIEHLRMRPQVSDLVNINTMYFTTNDGQMLQFEYKMLAFDKIVEHNGCYVIKLFAEVITNGLWAGQKYMNI